MRTITPYNLDDLQYLLKSDEGSLTAYFPLHGEEGKYADYTAEVSWRKEKISYTLGGHGIGQNTKVVQNKDEIIDRILEDNQRFNNGNAFQFESNDG